MICLIVAMTKTLLIMMAITVTMQREGHENVDDGDVADDTDARSMTVVMMMRCAIMTK